jgi:hypothetical protein
MVVIPSVLSVVHRKKSSDALTALEVQFGVHSVLFPTTVSCLSTGFKYGMGNTLKSLLSRILAIYFTWPMEDTVVHMKSMTPGRMWQVRLGTWEAKEI